MAVLTAKVLVALKMDLEAGEGDRLSQAMHQFASRQPHAALLLMGAGLMLGERPEAARRALCPAAYLCLGLRAAGRPPVLLTDAQLQATSRALCGPLLEALEHPASASAEEALHRALPPRGVREFEPEAFSVVVAEALALAADFKLPVPEALLLMAVHATAAWSLLASAGLVVRPWDHGEDLPDAGLADLADSVGAHWPWDDPEATVQSLECLGFHALAGASAGGRA